MRLYPKILDLSLCKMLNYILYKNPIELDCLAIVQYLYYLGFDVRPKHIFERNFPNDVITIPTIRDIDRSKCYRGLAEIESFYREKLGFHDNLLSKAREFKLNNPEYRIKK